MAIGSMLRQPMKTSYVDFYSLFQSSGKGLGNSFGRESERRLSIVYFF